MAVRRQTWTMTMTTESVSSHLQFLILDFVDANVLSSSYRSQLRDLYLELQKLATRRTVGKDDRWLELN